MTGQIRGTKGCNYRENYAGLSRMATKKNTHQNNSPRTPLPLICRKTLKSMQFGKCLDDYDENDNNDNRDYVKDDNNDDHDSDDDCFFLCLHHDYTATFILNMNSIVVWGSFLVPSSL